MSIKIDYSQLKKFSEDVKKSLDGAELNTFIEACAKELAARLLRKVIKGTHVGQYPKSSGKKGGTLRRGWTDEKQQSVINYVNSLNVTHASNSYTIDIINPVEYAPYVEYGHRTINHKSWVKGKFMLTISSDELKEVAPAILEKKLSIKLKEIFQ